MSVGFIFNFSGFQIGKRKNGLDPSEALQGLDFFGNKKSAPDERAASQTPGQPGKDEATEEAQAERQRKKKRRKMASG